jgi:hypothetical protein
MFNYSEHITYDEDLRCFVLEKNGKMYPLCAEGFQEAVIECELCDF